MKKTGIIIFILLLIGAVYFAVKITQNKQTITIPVRKISVSQRVLLPGKTVPSFILYQVTEGTNALDLLKKNYSVKQKGSGKYTIITFLNGKEANESKHENWVFFVNNKPSTTNAALYIIKPNDTLEWKIETR